MHLSKVYIENYRSIRKLQLCFVPGRNVVVGRNNAGKSNIIGALNLVLGEQNPSYLKSESFGENNFHSWREVSDTAGKRTEEIKFAKQIFIWCEIERNQGEPLNYDELYKCFGFYILARVVDWEGKKPIKEAVRISAKNNPADYKEIFDLDEDSNDKLYIQTKNRAGLELERQFGDKNQFAIALLISRNEKGEIQKETRFLYRESQADGWVMAFKANIRNELLQSAVIPSFRDPQSQLRLNHWSWYGKLMRHLTSNHNKQDELTAAFNTVKSVADEIFVGVRTQIKDSSLNVAFPGAEIYFQFNEDAGGEIYKNCSIYIDDGFRSPLSEKGSGIQSATIIGLFNYYTKVVNTRTAALLCVEEPELFLHPHARRVISDRLDDFIGDKNQVILTTHSTEFIRSTKSNLNVILVNKSSGNTDARSLNIEKLKSHVLDNNQNEMFFAEKVIVCEGYDAHVLRAISDAKFPLALNEQNVSVISAAGKDHIAPLARILVKLGIACYVLADFDYFLRDASEERKKYPGVKAHASVQSLDVTFFGQDHAYGPNGGGIASRIARLRAKIKESNERAFYCAKSAHEIDDDDLRDALVRLRAKGLCILDGEIESYCKDEKFLAPISNKLSLDKVYKLNNRIAGGEDIDQIFETGVFVEFLRSVLKIPAGEITGIVPPATGEPQSSVAQLP